MESPTLRLCQPCIRHAALVVWWICGLEGILLVRVKQAPIDRTESRPLGGLSRPKSSCLFKLLEVVCSNTTL